jgi:hypothetical protein
MTAVRLDVTKTFVTFVLSNQHPHDVPIIQAELVRDSDGISDTDSSISLTYQYDDSRQAEHDEDAPAMTLVTKLAH